MITLKHISTLSVFNQTKFSADSTDSSYFLGSDQTQIFQGTPDVKYNDLCYIKCSNLQYTHGHLYGSTEVGEAHVSLTQSEYDALSKEEKNNGKIYLIKDAEFHPENDIIISVYSSWSNTTFQNSNTNVDYWFIDGLSIPPGYEVIRYDVEISVISGDNAFNLSVANTNAYSNHLCVVYTCYTPSERKYIFRVKATCLKIS